MTDIRKKPKVETQDPGNEVPDPARAEDMPTDGLQAPVFEEEIGGIGEIGADAAQAQAWTEDQVRELKDQALRLMADMENLRRRHEREMDEARKYAMTAFARDLLEVLDNLGRALKSVPEDERGRNGFLETLVTGVEMTQKSLLGTFEKHRIQKVEPHRGERFDHNRHQAMYEVPTAEWPAGTIADIVQPGYVLAERLLRPALVGVAKAAPAAGGDAVAGGDEGGRPAGMTGGGSVDTSA